MYCANCQSPINDHAIFCPECYQIINHNQFKIIDFLHSHFDLFAIIGIFGAITALLLQFLNPISYIELNLTNLAYLQLTIVCNAFLILTFTVLILISIFDGHEDEIILTNYKIIKYYLRIGDPARFIFIVTVIIPLLVAIMFLANIFPLFTMIIYYCYLLLFLFVFYAVIYTKEVNSTLKNIWLGFSFLFIIGFIIFFGCTISLFVPSEINPSIIKIGADVEYYNPNLDSSIGIGVSPLNVNGRNLQNIQFVWSTNYGYFILWDKNENRAIYLGNKTIQGGNKIFWTYNLEDLNKPEVINLNLTINRGNKVLSNTSRNFTWFDQFIVET